MKDLKFTFATYNLNKSLMKEIQTTDKKALFLMRATRDTIVKAAKLRCPVDTGNLTASITGDVKQNKKSFSATCYVPINAPCVTQVKEIKDEKTGKITYKQCESPSNYAVWIHEGQYNLGKNSQLKQAKLPKIVVGPKFITRAIKDEFPNIINNIKKALFKK